MNARALVLAAGVTLLGAACATDIDVDPEGYRCDPGGICPAGYRCVNDVCRSEAHACDGVICSTPPAATCKDAQTLVTWGSGTCNPVTITCSYVSTEKACAQGCLDGACIGEDPCANVTCTTPPAAVCADANTLRTYASVGTCSAGACSYAQTDVPCQNGCANAQCQGQDLCQNVTCTTPPPPTCDAQGGRVEYAATGTCNPQSGQCDYPSSHVACGSGCAFGACLPAPLGFTQIGPRIGQALTALDIAPFSAGNSILAVGPKGFVTHWDGTSWTTVSSGTTADLLAVWLTSTSGYVVGAGGKALKWDGSALSPVAWASTTTAPTVDLVSVHGKGTHVLIAGADGSAYRSTDGITFARVNPPNATVDTIYQAFVNDDDGERLAGSCTTAALVQPCVLYSSGTTSTSTWYTDKETALSTPFTAVGPSHELNSAYVGIGTSVRRHTDSGTYDTLSAPTGLSGGDVVGISLDEGTATSTLFILTDASGGVGHLYRHAKGGTATSLLSLYGDHQALSRNDSGGVAVLDGTLSTSNVFRRGAVTNEALDLGSEDWVGVDATPGGRRVFINGYGDIASQGAGSATFDFARSPSGSLDYAGVVAGTTWALIFGKGGAYYRWTNLGGFVAGTAPGGNDLNAGCRNSDTEAWLVGAAGKIFKYDGVVLTAMSSPTTEALYDVTCTGAGEAWAVGDKGVLLRLSQGAWTLAAAPLAGQPKLTSVAPLATGDVAVAGDGLFALLAQGTWTTLPATTPLSNLTAAAGNALYATSGKSVVRFDGQAWVPVFTAASAFTAGTSAGGALLFAGPNGLVVEGK